MRINKLLLSVIVMLLVSVASWANTYSVDQIPNVHSLDSTQYVANPDGILNQNTVDQMNSLMREVRRTTSAEPMVVVVDNIDNDIDDFATELFGKWGLGKSDLDNGLLILVAKDMRKAVIRPGYGLEGVMPDLICAHILNNDMFPNFKQGDYDQGILAAARSVNKILMNPDIRDEILSSERDADTPGNSEGGADLFMAYLAIAGCMAVVMLLYLLSKVYLLRNRDYHDKYTELEHLKPVYLILTFVGIGLPLVASIPLLLLLQKWRNTRRICRNCGSPMVKIDEVHDNDYLDRGQDLEEQLGSVDYDVWLCPKCNETTVEPYVNRISAFKPCPKCGVRAYGLRSETVVRQPTTRSVGMGVRKYHCRACGYDHDKFYEIPRRADNDALLAGGIIGSVAGRRSGGFGGGSFGGGFGGGGFGGGMTGGGGASGGW